MVVGIGAVVLRVFWKRGYELFINIVGELVHTMKFSLQEFANIRNFSIVFQKSKFIKIQSGMPWKA